MAFRFLGKVSDFIESTTQKFLTALEEQEQAMYLNDLEDQLITADQKISVYEKIIAKLAPTEKSENDKKQVLSEEEEAHLRWFQEFHQTLIKLNQDLNEAKAPEDLLNNSKELLARAQKIEERIFFNIIFSLFLDKGLLFPQLIIHFFPADTHYEIDMYPKPQHEANLIRVDVEKDRSGYTITTSNMLERLLGSEHHVQQVSRSFLTNPSTVQIINAPVYPRELHASSPQPEETIEPSSPGKRL